MKKKTKSVLLLLLALVFILGMSTGCGSEEANTEKVTDTYADKMPSSDEIYGYIEELANLGVRQPGTEGGMAAQKYLMDKFNEFGLENVHIAYTDNDVWTCDDWKLEVQGTEIDSYKWYLSLYDGNYNKGGVLKEDANGNPTKHNGNYGTFSTADPGNVEDAEIVYTKDFKELKQLKDEEIKGKVVVSENRPLYYEPREYFYARDKGAVAFVGVLENYFDSNRYNPEDMTYCDGSYTIPGYYVTEKEGAHIKQLIDEAKEKGETPMAHFEMTVTAEKTDKAGAVVGTLPGKADGDGKMIMVSSHFDALTPYGASQDASGTSEVLAMAKFFSQIPQEERDRGIVFVLNDTHVSEYDGHDVINKELLGGSWDNEEGAVVPDASNTDVLVDVAVEHISKEGIIEDNELVMTGNVTPRTVYVTNSQEMVDVVNEEIAGLNDAETTGVTEIEEMGLDYDLCTDAGQEWYYGYGIPTVSYMSVMPYIYDDCDTMEMVPKSALVPVANSMANVIWRFMSMDESAFALPTE